MIESDIHNIKIVLSLMLKRQRDGRLNDVDLMLFKSTAEQLGITI